MIPAKFEEHNKVLTKPDGWTAEECHDIQAWVGDNAGGYPVVVSCWKPSPEELAEIQRTGQVWLHVHGQTMPPCYVGGYNPFKEPPDATTPDSDPVLPL